eukprot:gene13196-19030_t
MFAIADTMSRSWVPRPNDGVDQAGKHGRLRSSLGWYSPREGPGVLGCRPVQAKKKFWTIGWTWEWKRSSPGNAGRSGGPWDVVGGCSIDRSLPTTETIANGKAHMVSSRLQAVASHTMLARLDTSAPSSRIIAYADEAEVDEKDVVVLTTSNFDELVSKSKYALIEFYAPWCGHCKSLKPHYAAAATALKEFDGVMIAKVDATEEPDLGTKFGVKGYPSIKWFVDGKEHSEYGGGRDTEGIIKWVSKKAGPPASTVASTDELTAAEKKAEVVALGYFKELSGDDHATFTTVAGKIEDVAFLETTDAAVAKAAGLEAPGFVVIKNFAGEARETVPLSGDYTVEAIETLVNGEKLPLTIEFTKDNAQKIFQAGVPLHMFLWSKADDFKADSAVLKAYKAAAAEYKGKIIFVTANNEDAEAEPITKHFGLTDSPTVLGFIMDKNRKFKFTGEVTEDAIKEFAKSVADGTAVADFKSAAIPEDPLEDGVSVVVGKSFENIVLDRTKDVLLEVYAPWCGHCKKLTPIYAKLAKRFAKVDSVTIAKFDGTENEHEAVDAKGFPTILFFPAGEDKTPITFEGGDRSLKALTKFIKQHATVEYELAKKAGDEGETTDLKTEKDAKDEL